MNYIPFFLLLYTSSCSFSMEDTSAFIRTHMKDHYQTCLGKIKSWKSGGDSFKKDAYLHLISSCYNREYEIPESFRKILIDNNILAESETKAPELFAECVKEARKQISLNKRLRIK